jgi:ubiquitin-protein ligase
MSNAAERRLKAETQFLAKLQARSNYISIEFLANFTKRYIVTYTCTGIYCDENTKEIHRSKFHQMEVILPADYPRIRPSFRWITPIFHPNIQSKIVFYIGDTWNVSSKISDFLVGIGEMIQYKHYYLENASNRGAAAWAIQNKQILPIGRENLLEPLNEPIKVIPITKP